MIRTSNWSASSSLRISGLKDANIRLAQHVAILEYRLESLGKKMDEKDKTPSGENID